MGAKPMEPAPAAAEGQAAASESPTVAPTAEIELKLAATAEMLAQVRRSAVVASAGTPVRKHLDTVYYDTADRRLARRRAALRVRRSGKRYIQTLKTEGELVGALAARGEWESPIRGPDPDLSVITDPDARAVLGVILPGDLAPVFATRFARETRLIDVGGGGAPAAQIELALDDGRIETLSRKDPICELELELKSGSPAAVFDLARRLVAEIPLSIAVRSKAVRGYDLADGRDPSAVRAGDLDIGSQAPTASAIDRILRHCVDHWTANHEVVLQGVDPEGVHQMRVGLRRLRSAVSLFKSVLPGEPAGWLRSEARWLAGALGPAREWDVFLSDLLAPVETAHPGRAELSVLRLLAEEEKTRGYAAAQAAARDRRATDFLLRFGAWLADGGARSGTEDARTQSLDRPIAELAANLLDRRHQRVLKMGRGFAGMAVERRHALRIELKKLRYAVDFFAGLFPGKAARSYRRALARLQDHLGHLNDVAVAERMLTALIEQHASGTRDAAGLGLASGLVLGWHTRAVADSEPVTCQDWAGFAAVRPFWTRGRVE